MTLFLIQSSDNEIIKINSDLSKDCQFLNDIQDCQDYNSNEPMSIQINFKEKEIRGFIDLLTHVKKKKYFCLFEWIDSNVEKMSIPRMLNMSDYFQCDVVKTFVCKQIANKINKKNLL